VGVEEDRAAAALAVQGAHSHTESRAFA
jgi:hypothetical protein